MNCFPCCAPQRSKKSNSKREHGPTTPQEMNVAAKTPDMKKQRGDEQNQGDAGNIKAQNYTFRELATATKNFRQECLLGETGFGRVYKGIIPATGKAVAVKQLDRHGTESSKEFMDEVLALSLLHHENLSNLIGYCADGDQRLLVYEYIHARTLEDRLLENNKGEFPPLNWFDRMKVAAGASKGLEYLHNSANPPIIFRDLKTTNILLDGDLNVILVDFGMSKLSGGDKFNNAPPRVVGTFGYCAPEYVRTGQFSLKSDVYSFGIILLELITGRRAIDTTKPNEEQNLVSWAQPLFRDPKRYPDMADPLLKKHFPEKDLNQAVAIAAMCLQEEPEARPLMSDVVTALSFLSMVPTEVTPPSLPPTASVSKESCVSESEYESKSESESEAEDNETARNHVAASAKNQHGSSKSSRKSSRSSIDSGDGSVSSSSKSSRKWHGVVGNLSHKGSKKSASNKDPSQKGSKKSSTNKDQSQKSSRKSSIRDLIHKGSGKSSSRVSSHRSDGGSISSSSSYNSSVGSDSRRSGRSDINSSRRTEEESMRFDRASSMGSDEESVYSH